MRDWLLGIPYELAFWESSYKNKKTLKSLFDFSHLGEPLQLDGFDAQRYLLSLPDPLNESVLDVGSGMTFLPGNYINTNGQLHPINIHYVDPLADFYNHIAHKQKVDVPQVEFGMIEYLSSFYPEHNVSLIIIQNALDHCDNPLKGILEAIHSLKKGGVLYLNHHPNEAEYENYRGFHKYNIITDDKNLIIWNKQTRLNINDIIKDFAEISVCVCDDNPVAVITKTADVPTRLLNKDEDIKYLSKMLMSYTKEVISPANMLRYHIKLAYYRIGQRFSKLFSWQTRQKIKKIINKKL